MPHTPPSPHDTHDLARPLRRARRVLLLRVLVFSRAHRRWRWAMRAVVAVVLILAAALVVLTHSPLTRVILLPRIAAASGLNVEADWVYINRRGVVVMDNARFTIPGVDGDAGRFLRIARVRAGVDWWSVVRGSPLITGVTMIDPVLIVSQSRDDGSLNIGQVPIPSGSGPSMRVPPITATNVGLELGEHSKAGYHALKRIQMDGSVTPRPDEPGVYSVRLKQTARMRGPSAPPGPGFTLEGAVSDGSINLNLINFSLSDWPAATLPMTIREISEKLALTGEVSSTHFTYTRKDGITARMDVKGVAMNLPIEAAEQGPMPPPDPARPAPSRSMRMRGVDGTITFARDSVLAKVGGLIEDLPYQVTLRYDGVDENSPFNLDFTSEDFQVDRNPELLLYAPPVVKHYLHTVFLQPTGIVTTHVNVKRGPPIPASGDQPVQSGPITVSGSLDFREGTAAYENFPYEFMNLSGRFEFDNDQINIARVSGTSKTGAKLLASGRIAPLDETSEVDISIDVTEAQIDEAMEAGFGPGRSRVIKALFNDERYAQLLDAGLIRTPDQADAESKDLERLLALLPTATGQEADQAQAEVRRLTLRQRVPVFAFRGSADISVKIHAPRGVDVAYQTGVDIRIPAAGLIPEKFPYPIIARDVEVQVRNQDGRLIAGSFQGVAGGRADIAASFNVPSKSSGETQVQPDIDIRISEFPIDELMIRALPGQEGPDASPVKRILRALHASGAGEGKIHIGAREGGENGDLGFDADIDIINAEARPPSFEGSGKIAIAGLSGHFEASEKLLFLDIEGVPVIPPATDEQLVGPPVPLNEGERIGGTLTAHVRGEFPPAASQAPASFFVSSTCRSFDIESPFESLVGVFSPKAAGAVQKSRTEARPSGIVNVKTVAESGADHPLSVRVELTGGKSLAASVLGGRLELPEAGGKVTLRVGDAVAAGPMLEFDAVSGAPQFEGEPAGIVSIDGSLPMGGGGADTSSLDVSFLDARLESLLTQRILEQRLGADAVSFYSRIGPSGIFDATMIVRPAAESYSVFGRIEPRSLAFTIDGRPVVFTSVGGSVEFEPGSGILRGLTATAPEWSVRTDGAWTLSPSGEVSFRSALSGRGNKLSEDLRALMPAELRDVLGSLKANINGPFKLTDASLDVGRGGAAGSSSMFSGKFDFTDASLEAGVPISNMNGGLLVHFDNPPGAAFPEYRLDVRADRFEISGVTLLDARATVKSGAVRGQVIVPEASGVCHGGRFAVRADVSPDGKGPDAPRRFRADFQLGGIRFNTLLRELVDSVKPFVGPPAPAEVEAALESAGRTKKSKQDEFSRGLLDAEVALEGLVADPLSRRGRGTVRVSGGRVLNVPFMTGLVEASNLQFPTNSRLDFARAKFYLEGPLITFEDLSVQSRAIELVGRGTMTWPGRELDLRFDSRAARPIPIISDIIQGLRDQLITTTVTGKLGEQVVGIQSPGPTRMLRGPFGGNESQHSRARADEERRTAADRDRERRKGRGIQPEAAPPIAVPSESSAVPTDR